MAAKSGIPSSLLLLLVVVGIFAFGAEALKVVNHLTAPLTVSNLPGCCSPCGKDGPPPGQVCPEVCVQCADEVLTPGKAVRLDRHVGPYPLNVLKIQVGKGVSCLSDDGLTAITASSTLVVGPGLCGPGATDFQAFVQNPSVTTCLQDCSLSLTL